MVASEANPSGCCRKHLCLSDNAEYQVVGGRGMWLLGTWAEKGVEHGLGVLSLSSSASSCQPSSGYQGKWASVLIWLCCLSLEHSFKPPLYSPLYPLPLNSPWKPCRQSLGHYHLSASVVSLCLSWFSLLFGLD